LQCQIPTVLEAARSIEQKRKETGSNVGLYIETKRPQWHRDLGLPLEEKLLQDIKNSGFSGTFY
jgi:glycerophosphoryl diester phosphodiesterase